MTTRRSWNAGQVDATIYRRASEFPPRLKLLRWLGRQTWIPKGQDRLLRAILDPDTCPHFLFEVDFFGQKYRGDLAQFIDWTVFCYGAAPYSEISLLQDVAAKLRLKRPGPVNFVDVGANVGHHTLFMARIADQVWAFEPFPALYPLIEAKIALNGLRNVHLMRVALGEKDDVLDYYPGQGANSGIGTFLPDGEKREAQPVKLPIKHGDSFFAEQGVDRIDIMKVDVEGFEPYVFRGLQNRIRHDQPVILTEISATSRDGFGSEAGFRNCFYDGARFAAVSGRAGCKFTLSPFVYETSEEVLILPPGMQDLIPA
jgi:FkbM family methyltransferase